MHTLGANARAASPRMAAASTAAKNDALMRLAGLLRASRSALHHENAKDITAALAAQLPEPMVDRLRLKDDIIDTIALGCEQLAAMADPVGEITGMKRRPSGIQVGHMRVPLGVFGMVYESRPNVTIEAASLSIVGPILSAHFRTRPPPIARGPVAAATPARPNAAAHRFPGSFPRVGNPPRANALFTAEPRSSRREP